MDFIMEEEDVCLGRGTTTTIDIPYN